MDEAHGTSVFARDEAGTLYHTYSTYGRGLDVTNAAYSYIDMAPMGRNEQPEGNPMEWVRHHDAYWTLASHGCSATHRLSDRA